MNVKMLAAAAALATCVPFVAQAQDDARGGISFRGEARIGYETPTVSGDGDVYKIGSAVSYGGELGVDFDAGGFSVGPYVNYEFSNVELCDGGVCLSEKGNLSAGGRVGFAVGQGSQLFVKVGYASIEMEGSVPGYSASESKSGIQGAIGATFDVGPHVYAMVEASYADYGKFYDINLQRRQVAAGVGFRF